MERKRIDLLDCTAKTPINQGFSRMAFQSGVWFSSDAPSTSRTTLRAIFQTNFSNLNLGKWREKLERKRIDLLDCTAKTPINQGFSRMAFQSGVWFSSQPRYDHFDTSPNIYFVQAICILSKELGNVKRKSQNQPKKFVAFVFGLNFKKGFLWYFTRIAPKICMLFLRKSK